jgi:excisionase family DNA binding protein
MPAPKNLFTVTREDASEQLNVSLRTLDRYLRRGKLKSHSDGRVVLVHSQSLAEFAKKLSSSVKNSAPAKKKKHSPRREMPEAEAVEVSNEAIEEKVFRELYDEASKDLKAKQEKLEAASFRVGQLEAQLKNSVPLLEHKKKEEELGRESSRLKEKLVAAILKSWVFLGLAIIATIVAGVFGFLLFV